MYINSFYVPWDFDLFVTGIRNFTASVGEIADIALWIFFIIAGIAFIRSLL